MDAEAVPESIEIRLSKLPDEQDREFDVVLGMLMLNGLWQTRRVVWSKELISFTKVGEDTVFDAIPLVDVVSIQHIIEQPGNEASAKNLLKPRPRSAASITSSTAAADSADGGPVAERPESYASPPPPAAPPAQRGA
eukprot:CAMPEP_0172179492 /NCGR_PEP_ID=MMETSP1050-20130122/16652_1 /TAXON_ID=233186 /ORGANISM="Cryptomonas curvata, Strain CCAP979/52" /LENGTH=136 /DNA_ID=CAMNT_0012852389 /DNA_START=145 /DNA_END=551 /DNA_ORIENTATION=+